MFTALISVSHKEGVVPFTQALVEKMGAQIISTGGTATTLRNGGVPVTEVEEITGFPSILGGRVKTLAEEIHGGILATKDTLPELEELGFPYIDLVYVTLYELEQEIAKTGATVDSVLEQTDMGGVALLRSASKGRRITICDPHDLTRVLDWLEADQPDRDAFIAELCLKADVRVLKYQKAATMYHGRGKVLGIIGEWIRTCKYGENPYQIPTNVYSLGASDPLGLDTYTQLSGMEPSFINETDFHRLTNTITRIAAGFDVNREGLVPRIAVAVKHGNACGAAVGNDTIHVLEKLLLGDLTSIHGSVVMTNFPIGKDEAVCLREYRMEDKKRMFDGLMAPTVTEEAIEELQRTNKKCRILANPALTYLDCTSLDQTPQFTHLRNEIVAQPANTFILDHHEFTSYGSPLTQQELEDLVLAWAIGSTSDSNTITITKDGMLLANAVRQQSRVRAAKLALMIAKEGNHDLTNAVAYSDSFFPYPDAVEILIQAGIGTIFASSGSLTGDKLVIPLCESFGVSLHMLPDKDCRGFYGH